MANSISSQIRQWELARKEKRKSQYVPYFRGLEMLIAGEKKKKQEAETKEAYKNIYLYENLGEMPDIPIASYPSDISMRRERKRTYQEMLGYGAKLPEGKQWYEFTPEEWKNIESDYYSEKPELKETQTLENYRKGYELKKELKKKYKKKPTGAPTEPFTRYDIKAMPNLETMFPFATDKDYQKVVEVLNAGGMIYPGEYEKTIKEYKKIGERTKAEEKRKEDLEKVQEDLKKYKSTFKYNEETGRTEEVIEYKKGRTWITIPQSVIKGEDYTEANKDYYDALDKYYEKLNLQEKLQKEDIGIPAAERMDTEYAKIIGKKIEEKEKLKPYRETGHISGEEDYQAKKIEGKWNRWEVFDKNRNSLGEYAGINELRAIRRYLITQKNKSKGKQTELDPLKLFK